MISEQTPALVSPALYAALTARGPEPIILPDFAEIAADAARDARSAFRDAFGYKGVHVNDLVTSGQGAYIVTGFSENKRNVLVHLTHDGVSGFSVPFSRLKIEDIPVSHVPSNCSRSPLRLTLLAVLAATALGTMSPQRNTGPVEAPQPSYESLTVRKVMSEILPPPIDYQPAEVSSHSGGMTALELEEYYSDLESEFAADLTLPLSEGGPFEDESSEPEHY